MVLTFEELSQNPVRAAQSVFDWLGISTAIEPVPVRAQQGGIPLSGKLLSNLDARLQAKRLIKRLLPKLVRLRLRAGLYSVLLEKPKAELEVEDFLREIYRPEIEALETLLERDFLAWK